MFILVILPLSYAVATRLSAPPELGVLILFSTLGWLTARAIPSTQKRLDMLPKGLGLLPIFAYFFFVIGAVFTTTVQPRHILIAIAAYGLVACGGLLNFASVRKLGVNFTPQMTLSEQHSLQTNGVYQIVRHPKYLAGLVSGLGVIVVLSNVFAFFGYGLLLLGYVYRIQREEHHLSQTYGQDWEAYRKSTKRLIPYIY